MANSLATQILVDGARNAVVKVVGVNDTSNVSAVDIVDPASFSPVPTGFRIDRVSYLIDPGTTCKLWWDANTDVLAITLTGSGGDDFKAKQYGGLINNAGAGVTGKIQLTTEGWASSAVDNFTFVLELVKMGV